MYCIYCTEIYNNNFIKKKKKKEKGEKRKINLPPACMTVSLHEMPPH
jgi:hypothetical protein